MSQLPASFSYYANRLSGVSRRTLKLTPNNSTTVKQNETVTFVLPTDAICDLTSMQMIYRFKYQNAPVVGANAKIRYTPAPHQLVRSAVWQINGTAVSGSSNQNFSQVYEALRVASSGNDNVNSRVDEYNAPPVATLNGASDSKIYGTKNERVASNTRSRRCKMTDFLGLQTNPNASNYDSALLGETRLELQMNGNECALIQGVEACDPADADWQIEDVHMLIDVISFSSPEYDMLMSAMLQEGSLLIPFNEITSQKSLLNSSIRFNVASSSLDMIGYALLKDNHNTYTNVLTGAGDPIAEAGAKVSDFTDGLVPNQVQLCYRDSTSNVASSLDGLSDQVTASWYFTINGQVYPSSGSTPLIESADFTKQIYANSKDDYNQLFLGHSTAKVPNQAGAVQDICPAVASLEYSKQYKRVNFLDRNCFVAMRTCLDVPAAQSPNHALSGLNTLGTSSQIQLSLTGFNNSTDYALMIAQGSSVLQVGAGQQISVIN